MDEDRRADQLTSAFKHHFAGARPTHLVRAPGRVNLIGDHTDYNGLAVFPMAISRDLSILFRARGDRTVRLVSVDPRFEPLTFLLQESIPPSPRGTWGNYVKAAAQALARRFGVLRGFDGVMSGNIPVAVGLSSSSALVVGCGVLLASRNEIRLDRSELADLLAKGERYVGTQGGGMDQAICLLARQGMAAVIDFHPLRFDPLPIPTRWRFIIASTLIAAEKSGPAQAAYNQRTKECKQALELLRQAGAVTSAGSYAQLMASSTTESLVAEADGTLPSPLRQRFRHVITEAARVARAKAAMEAADMSQFGALMLESHRSLKEDYEVSCPELDDLVGIATAAGARGARLTGAGFGGCIVALCDGDNTEGVMAALTNKYYASRNVDPGLGHHLFVAHASAGASVQPLA